MLEHRIDRTDGAQLPVPAAPIRYAPRPTRPAEPGPALQPESTVQELFVEAQEDLGRLRRIVLRAGFNLILYEGTHGTYECRVNPRLDRGQFGSGFDGGWPDQRHRSGPPPAPIGANRSSGVAVRRTLGHFPPTAGFACPPAPIVDPDGVVIAAVGISSTDRELGGAALSLARSVALTTAHAIEERLFRKRYNSSWIVAIGSEDVTLPGMLLAVDGRQRILAADRHARQAFDIDGLLDHDSLWAIFERDMTPFRRADVGDLAVSLMRCGTGERWPALITPPDAVSKTWCSPYVTSMRFRARLDAVDPSSSSIAPPPVTGGLSSGALRRVRAYVDAHLGSAIEVRTLSGIAGLSLWHFARSFKTSVGMTPRAYLLLRRVEHARDLLTQSDLPLAQIALASGFCDQSHFSRSFRQHVGVSPLAFRRAAN
jgi:AraC-like DNA-binding protein